MFSCDVLGKRKDGSLVALQVTAGQAPKVLERKKKLEKETWHTSDTVQILQLVQTDNPGGKGSRKLWFFRVFEYCYRESGHPDWFPYREAVPIPKEWFKKWKETDK